MYYIHSIGIINSSFYNSKVKGFMNEPRIKNQIVFLGDSITDYVNFDEILPDYHIINRGIAGDTTSGVLRRLNEVISLKPTKIFILIGTNDIGMGVNTIPIANNIRTIITRIHEKLPDTKIYLQSLFPTRHHTPRPNTEIQALNIEIQSIAQNLDCTFINLYPLLLDSDGELAENYTIDGLHLSESANKKWLDFIKHYIDE